MAAGQPQHNDCPDAAPESGQEQQDRADDQRRDGEAETVIAEILNQDDNGNQQIAERRHQQGAAVDRQSDNADDRISRHNDCGWT